MPSPPNMLQSPTQDQQSSSSIHAAALNPSSLIPHQTQAIPLASQVSLPTSNQNHSPPSMQLQGPPLAIGAPGTVSAPPMLPSAAHAHVSGLQPAQLAAAYASVSAARSRHNSLTHPPQPPPTHPPQPPATHPPRPCLTDPPTLPRLRPHLPHPHRPRPTHPQRVYVTI